ncbi:MAG: tryptophan-rich sensory protein [Hydrogenophaga sp.]|nr:tryptophan-rich sensory protein [Hydrogenophaga sp.]MDO9569543.1 tryptophan-rich sensory protein [Hydrogenophaga sp.]MDP1895081.1 tryptophan-rich sensory protein [Hydrogenophaga sp.]MDP2096335.1 tryptophan-rich sensory protein [Hydrogenophaga sp.]MDP3374764.1 tryptophan-rich sensory protein [Hydrogenophaga sp.]MDP3924530.1 tryptophan-rich sensory protein [Hydrogenophaga sp.]
MAAFWRIRPLVGALLVPYLAWVGFAADLNWVLWRANPVILG